jgi:cysteine desulfurase/selenocysteine lyase
MVQLYHVFENIKILKNIVCIDMNKFRSYFPFFRSVAGQQSMVWFDNAATTQKPVVLLETEQKIYQDTYANIHRGMYATSEAITAQYEQARASVGRWINAQRDEIFFTSGTTAGLNCAAAFWGSYFVKAGDEIIISAVEHHANFLPWQRLAEQTGAVLTVIPINPQTFRLEIEKVSLSEKTKIVALTQYSNVLGDVWDGALEAFCTAAQKIGAFVILDAAQSVAHRLLDVQKMPVDYAVFSAHKICGSTGVGAAYLNKKWHEILPPFFVGGGMVSRASYEVSTWLSAPLKFEAGTPAIVQAIAWGKTLDFLQETITPEEKKNLKNLMQKLVQGLQAMPEISLLGNLKSILQSSLVTFFVPGIHAHDIAACLADKQIAVRAGHHCAQPLFDALQIASSVRVSLFYYNTPEDVDYFLTVLPTILKQLR